MRLGEWDLTRETDCQNRICADAAIDVPIKEIFIHEDYVADSVGHAYDIALIQLGHSVKLTQWIRPICLPVTEQFKQKNYDTIPLDVHGWGYTSSLPNGKFVFGWNQTEFVMITFGNISKTSEFKCHFVSVDSKIHVSL